MLEIIDSPASERPMTTSRLEAFDARLSFRDVTFAYRLNEPGLKPHEL